MHIITKAKRNCVAYQQPVATSGKRGRPRKKGVSVKLFDLFESANSQFSLTQILLYGKQENVRYLYSDLLWGQGLYKMLRFVLVEYNNTRTILVSTNLTLEPLDIIKLYGKRFGIEVMFREMKQVISAFGYRFWSKYMPKLNRFKKKTDPEPVEQLTDSRAQKRVKLAVKAIEGFIFCAIAAIGIMQMTSLRFSGTNELTNLRFLRTRRSSIASEATIADFLTKNFFPLLHQHPNLPLNQIISSKQGITIDTAGSHDVA